MRRKTDFNQRPSWRRRVPHLAILLEIIVALLIAVRACEPRPRGRTRAADRATGHSSRSRAPPRLLVLVTNERGLTTTQLAQTLLGQARTATHLVLTPTQLVLRAAQLVLAATHLALRATQLVLTATQLVRTTRDQALSARQLALVTNGRLLTAIELARCSIRRPAPALASMLRPRDRVLTT